MVKPSPPLIPMVGKVIEDAVGERAAAVEGAAEGEIEVVGGAGVISLPQAASNKTRGIKNKSNLLNFKPVTSSFIKGIKARFLAAGIKL